MFYIYGAFVRARGPEDEVHLYPYISTQTLRGRMGETKLYAMHTEGVSRKLTPGILGGDGRERKMMGERKGGSGDERGVERRWEGGCYRRKGEWEARAERSLLEESCVILRQIGNRFRASHLLG